MTKTISFCDKALFFALLVFVIFIPYSIAVTQTVFFGMIFLWLIKHYSMSQNKVPGALGDLDLIPRIIAVPLLLLGLLILLTFPFSFDPALSLKKFFSRFLQQILLMFIVGEVVNSQRRLYAVLVMLLCTLTVVYADIGIQMLVGKSFIFSSALIFERITGPFRHPNDLGSFLVTIIPVVFSMFLTRNYWIPIIVNKKFSTLISCLVFLLFLFSVIALGLTASRGAWIAFAVTSILYGLLLKNSRLIVITVVLLVSFFLFFGNYCMDIRSDISTRNKQAKTVDQTASDKQMYDIKKTFLNLSSRNIYWHLALEVTKQRPLFGCGYNAYIQTLKKLQLNPVEYPHSSVFQILAETGIIGLVLHLCFFGGLFILGIKTIQSLSGNVDLQVLAIGILSGLVAWFIHSLTDTTWESLLLNFLWWMLIGLLLSLRSIAAGKRIS